MNHEQTLKDYSQVGKACWGYLLLQIILSFSLTFIFLSAALSILPIDITSTLSFQANLSALIPLLSMALAPIIVITFQKKNLRWNFDKEQFRYPHSPKLIFRYYALILGFNFGLGLLLTLLSTLIQAIGGSEIVAPDISMSSQPFYDVLLFLQIVVIAPILEEIFFRGLILQSLQRYNKNLAIFASALLFSLLHLNLAQSVPAFFSGLIFGYLAIQYRSLSLPILVHMLNNAISFGITNTSSSIILTLYSIICIFALFYSIYKITTYIKKHPNIDYSIPDLKTWIKRPAVLSFVIFSLLICVFALI